MGGVHIAGSTGFNHLLSKRGYWTAGGAAKPVVYLPQVILAVLPGAAFGAASGAVFPAAFSIDTLAADAGA